MRRILSSLLFVCVSLCAFGQGVLVPPQVALKTVNGITTPIANATITVCAALTGGIPCSPVLVGAIFRDAALTQPLTNPFTSDSSGNYQFAIAAGNYTVTVTASGFNGYSYQITAGGSGGASFPVTTPVTVSTGGSISPGSGSGQIVGTQNWWSIGTVNPNTLMTMNPTGGSISINQFVLARLTLVNAVGETLAGAQGQSANCTSGSVCSVTLAAPPLPLGYTGYNVYACVTTSNCTALKYTGCINITTSCTITTSGTGAVVPAANTAYLTPSSQGTNLCSPSTNPALYIYDGTSFFGYAGVDSANTASNPPGPYNKFSFCRPVWFNDTNTDPPLFRNSLVDIFHLQNNVTTTNTNQDGGLHVFTTNCLPTSGACSDSTSHYALEGIQVEQDVNGSPTITGSPDGEVAAGSFQTAMWNTSAYASQSGTVGIRSSLFREPSANVDTGGMASIRATFANTSTVSGGNVQATAFSGSCSTTVTVAAFSCAILTGGAPSATSAFASGQFGWRQTQNASFVPNFTAGNGNTGDLFIRNEQHNWAANFNAPLYLNGINQSDSGVIPIGDPISVKGSETITQTAADNGGGIPICPGAPGSSQYTYVLVALDGNGGAVTGGTRTTAANCANPLTSGNPATVFPGYPVGMGIVSLKVYRTAGPMTTGLIGSYTCGLNNSPINGCNAFSDTGLAGDGTSPPSANTTGGTATPGYSALKGNKFFVASNFTTAANTNLQTITGLVFNLSPAAGNYQFHCSLSYSQATANAAVAFGIQASTANPTNIFANGTIQTNTSSLTPGTLATLATTTATNIVSATPAAIGTNFIASLDGTIEEPASGPGNTINIMVSTAASGDAVTVLRGSYCYLY